MSTNHCGSWGLACDILPVNSVINCWDNPNFDQCVLAAIDVGATVSAVGRGAELAGKGADLLGKAADTAGETLPGVAKGWAQRAADNGKGTVWQEPGSTGNANSIRVMDPNAQYSNGYVRFYNEHGQPIGLDGKPGPNSVTHIPRGPDGSYPLPKGWGQ